MSPASSQLSSNGIPARPINTYSTSSTSVTSSDRRNTVPAVDEPVNLHHMELLSHAILNRDLFNLGDNVADDLFCISYGLEAAVASPYLLNQLLAFSARHLAFLNPDRYNHYIHQAVTLQTRAISLFNAAWRDSTVDKGNCVPVLLFSVVLGHHLLADSLTTRGSDDSLDAFLTHFVQGAETNRGIYNVCSSAWPLLMESKLKAILSFSAGFTSRQPRGKDCQRVLELIDSPSLLCEEDKEACRLATRYLQVGFDALLADHGESGNNRYGMIFSWTMLVRPEFTALLTVKTPQALVVLAYYALLLYNGREMWQVGNAGTYMLESIEQHLGPEWDYWIQYPLEMLGRGLE
ncbi:hypothetical protein K4F52_003999 [Lecanicillium sp. MT-2017a]|nr:hypothetical protein K4F52_003999 [Lecanicillium sp. MT-2017a]